MKVVVDTNVFISGVFFSGPPNQILRAWRENRIEILISPQILEEYARVGERLTDRFEAVTLEPAMKLVLAHTTIVEPEATMEPIASDPDDDKFFACALAGGSRLIISGDKHLLAVTGKRGVRVLKPREFVEDYLS